MRPRLFETHSRRLLATFPPPREAPLNEAECLNFSPDGQWVLAAKSDGETMGWSLPQLRGELSRLGLDWTASDSPPSDGLDSDAGSTSERLSRLLIRPERLPDTDPRLVDLSRHFNASLTEHWHPGEGSSDLSELPQGIQVLAGAPFDVRGLIQCRTRSRGGKVYPRRITGIAIEQPVRRLHFLHAAIHASSTSPGTVIGTYAMRAKDGRVHELPLRMGYEIADWRTQEDWKDPSLEVAWIGRDAASRTAGRTIRLFKTTWTNPTAGAVISTVDIVSTQALTSPCLLAITVE